VKLPERGQDERWREGVVDGWTRTSRLLAQPQVHPSLLLCLQSLVPSLLWSFVDQHPLSRLSGKFPQLFKVLHP